MLHGMVSSLLHRLDASLRWHDRTGGYAVPEGETTVLVEHGAVRSSRVLAPSVIPAQAGIQSVSEGETTARVEHGAVRSSPDSSRSIGHPGAGRDPVRV
jgi:hypothetical protein